YWILHMVETANKSNKKALLIYLVSIFQYFLPSDHFSTKCQYRVTNDNKNLLEGILKYDTFSEDEVIKILSQLQEQ
ncbi:23183_t:CDS:2, partial [Racocetra persica]